MRVGTAVTKLFAQNWKPLIEYRNRVSGMAGLHIPIDLNEGQASRLDSPGQSPQFADGPIGIEKMILLEHRHGPPHPKSIGGCRIDQIVVDQITIDRSGLVKPVISGEQQAQINKSLAAKTAISGRTREIILQQQSRLWPAA